MSAEIKYHRGDLFKHIRTIPNQKIIIPHVVNNKGAFGAGFVVPLGKTWPKCKEEYHKWMEGGACLGEVLFSYVEDDITVAHMCAQTLGGKRPLYYNALVECMEEVANIAFIREVRYEQKPIIVCPQFASGLAGGNWGFIEELIVDCWLRQDIEVTVCVL